MALAIVNVKLHASMIRKRLHKFDVQRRYIRKKHLLSKQLYIKLCQRTPRERLELLEQCALDMKQIGDHKKLCKNI